MMIALGSLSDTACGSSKRTIRIPDSVVPNPKSKDGAARPAIPPYVIKMSDGKRIYQVEIPNPDGRAVSSEIPLESGGLATENDIPQTEADKEIIEAKRARGEPTPKAEDGGPAKTRSYLATLGRVTRLFRKRQYELALIDLTALDREYPDDERILEMKGTLYSKLRRMKQAREAWERVLALNPSNTVVAQALEQLSQDGE